MSSWPSLPNEIKFQILQYLVTSKYRQYESPASRHARRQDPAASSPQYWEAQYATVNREWQAYFEANNFSHLVLGHEDVDDFGTIVVRPGRGRFIRFIWLRIELFEYGCDKCTVEPSFEEIALNNSRFTRAIWVLFELLSQIRLDDPSRGISLELSVHSPSDAEHFCQELRGIMHDSAHSVSMQLRDPSSHNDATHGWDRGLPRPLTDGAQARAFGPPLGIGIVASEIGKEPYARLPRVDVVHELCIRAQFPRVISVRHGIDLMMTSMPNIHSLKYERIQMENRIARSLQIADNCYLITTTLPRCPNLRHVALGELASGVFTGGALFPPPDPATGRALATHSTHLQYLYVSGLAHAESFFSDFWPGARPQQALDSIAPWTRLRELSLFTKLLNTPAGNLLLQAAAAAAGKMPQLLVMEIMGCRNWEHFIYRVLDREHQLLATKEVLSMLEKTTTSCWEAMPAARGESLTFQLITHSTISVPFARPSLISNQAFTPATRLQAVLEHGRRFKH